MYRVKFTALGRNIEQAWGWDDESWAKYYQFGKVPPDVYIIIADDADIGWIALKRSDDSICITGIVLLPEFQGNGIGTRVIGGILHEARASSAVVRLEVFKTNPAVGFYKRLGFGVTGETETHFRMKVFS
ncbi:MAG: GNAT family N-acetyltransferase [Gammaproteobacteria bacterium]|nr:GNAT family N-acetyltransferase [Gammaproteobacteria bacterium]